MRAWGGKATGEASEPWRPSDQETTAVMGSLWRDAAGHWSGPDLFFGPPWVCAGDAEEEEAEGDDDWGLEEGDDAV